MRFFQVITLLKENGYPQLYLRARDCLTDEHLYHPSKWFDVKMYSGTELVALMDRNRDDWLVLPIHPAPRTIKQICIPPGCIELIPEHLLTLGLVNW